ncbi:hypothetical protein Q604_UNBC01946G0001, partial [human gut metagenome]
NAITENNKEINNTINKVNVKVDGIKGDLNGLTKRVDQNEKDINVAGTIAIENRKFIGDNKKAIDELKGQVGNTVKNIETTINNKITENNVTINKNIDTKIEANNTVINQNITNAITENNKEINN